MRVMNRLEFELTPRSWTVTIPPIWRSLPAGIPPSCDLSSQLDTLVVVVVNVIVHARFKCLNAFDRCEIEVLGF